MKAGRLIGRLEAKRNGYRGFTPTLLRASFSAMRITTIRMRRRVTGLAFALKRERWQNMPESNLLTSGTKFY